MTDPSTTATAPASGGPTRADLLDPAHLASLGRIEIVARWVVEGFLTGLHRSPRKGFSVEFAEHRPYMPGDDLRYMDWKILARADRWMIKQFEEETNLRAALVLDVSKSMDWTGSGDRLTKLSYAEHLVAALAHLLIRQKDAAGLVRFDDELKSVLSPRARSVHFYRLVRTLAEGHGGKGARISEALFRAERMIRRPGMIIVVSDLLFEPSDIDGPIKSLRAAGHNVGVLHIMDPSERALTSAGEAIFCDTESDLQVSVSVADVEDAYRETVDHVIEEWRTLFSGAGVEYAVVTTDTPFGVPLRKAFRVRENLP
ncbi:MAG TPA: DUF58 domain-containing protein [Gemmatimonadaceae bacterium]|jgi:uncharacterized protein (DUF58 family)|nr:DUF58 domain-containing protein [Gemmatimonadaceae bacterium]